jgi:quercetin dioxygenase-like cupin family protein
MNAATKEQQHKQFSVSSRRLVAEGSDMFVKEFNLGPGEGIPWHSHTQVFDIFYCLEGQLEIESKDLPDQEDRPRITLAAGGSARIEAGTAHHPFNAGSGPCRFLLIQGVGKYDFLPLKTSRP